MKTHLKILMISLFLISSCAMPTKNPKPEEKPETPIVNDTGNDLQSNDNLYDQFAKRLQEETLNESLNWDTVFQITHEYETDHFNYILESNEFHEVYDLKSYGIANEDGLSIFILNEQFESGKDGMISIENYLDKKE